ncbi:MAG: ribonuclease HII [Nitrospirota bacterium]
MVERDKRKSLDMTIFEKREYSKGYKLLAGIDEAGRGPLAGPVVASAVILPKDYFNPEIKDSKKLTVKKREVLFDEIRKRAVAIGIGIVKEDIIDEINILQAALLAMRKAVMDLSITPDSLLIDALSLSQIDIPQQAIIKGDSLSLSIASASIIAKVTRDRLMTDFHYTYPRYNFLSNKGYGTREHIQNLKEYGPCKIHRKTFRGVLNNEPHK